MKVVVSTVFMLAAAGSAVWLSWHDVTPQWVVLGVYVGLSSAIRVFIQDVLIANGKKEK